MIRENTRSFPKQITVEDAQYVYRDLPYNVRPGGWWGVPFFINSIPSGTYVGSSDVENQFNRFSYENYDFSRFNPPAETTTADESTAPAETIPPSGAENTDYEG